MYPSEIGGFGLPTFRLMTADITPASGKYHIVCGNNASSAQRIYLLGLFCRNLAITTITGGLPIFELRRVTIGTLAGGASITPLGLDTSITLENVTAYGGATGGLTDVSLLDKQVVHTDEHTAAVANTIPGYERISLLPQYERFGRPLVLQPGEAFAVKQNGAVTAGTLAWILDIGVLKAVD